MGKSTTAKMFAELGCRVWDADAAAHRAYGPNGAAVAPIRDLAPDAIGSNGVSREGLKAEIQKDPSFLKKLEAIVHPLVLQDRLDFIIENEGNILVFDIPLLFETGAQSTFDAVACVLTTPGVQKTRVMARPGMSKAHFEFILSKQMPAEDKATKADYVIPTDTLDQAKASVQNIVSDIQKRRSNA